MLAYYADPSDLYFPSGNIDLRYGISAALSESKDKAKPSSTFSVTTHQRVYLFKADSTTSAKEWVRTLQKVIFRSHNDGDSVKVSLPVENVIDIDDSPVLDFAETFKIRVVDNDETYAIDEVGPALDSLSVADPGRSTSSPSSASERRLWVCCASWSTTRQPNTFPSTCSPSRPDKIWLRSWQVKRCEAEAVPTKACAVLRIHPPRSCRRACGLPCRPSLPSSAPEPAHAPVSTSVGPATMRAAAASTSHETSRGRASIVAEATVRAARA